MIRDRFLVISFQNRRHDTGGPSPIPLCFLLSFHQDLFVRQTEKQKKSRDDMVANYSPFSNFVFFELG